MREVTRCARGMFCANRAQYPSASKLSTERASPSTNHYSFLLAYNRAKSASLLSHVKNWQWKEMQGKTLCGFNWRALFGSLSSITISTAITIRFVTVIMQKKKKCNGCLPGNQACTYFQLLTIIFVYICYLLLGCLNALLHITRSGNGGGLMGLVGPRGGEGGGEVAMGWVACHVPCTIISKKTCENKNKNS